MSRVTLLLAVILCLLCLIILIPVVIGIYVYRDASRRKMNALLWVLIAVVTPVFVGLIIYLLVRGNYADLECPSCQADVTKEYVVCPKCGTRLKAACPKCGFSVEQGWKVCPRCASVLDEEISNVMTPIVRRDKGLWKLLIAVVVIPTVMLTAVFALIFGLNLASARGGSSASNITSYTEEDVRNYQNDPRVWEWIEESRAKDPDKIYVLHYQEERENVKATIYLIYRPSAGNNKSIRANIRNGFFRDTVVVSFEDTDDPRFDHTYSPMTCVAEYCGRFLGLELIVDGEKVDYEMIDVEYNPALFEITGED